MSQFHSPDIKYQKENSKFQTKSEILTQPIESNFPPKVQIFDLARKHYTQNIPLSPTISSWGTVKTQLQPRSGSFLDQKIPFPALFNHPEYYDYSMNSGVPKMWAVFANKYLGGGYKGHLGWVQEEIITAEYLEMAYGIGEYEEEEKNLMEVNESVLWLNLTRNSQANPSNYGGRNMEREFRNGTFDPNHYLQPVESYQMANFVSIDAPRRNNRNAPYTLEEIQHLFIKAIAGFESCVNYGYKSINTGNWGGGVFGNRFSVVLFVQGLAAWLSGMTEFHYWGTKDVQNDAQFPNIWTLFQVVGNQGYTPRQIYDHARTGLGLNFTLDQILEPILE